MRLRLVSVALAAALSSLVACDAGDAPDAAGDEANLSATPEAEADLARDVISTGLELDLRARTGKATIKVAPSERAGLSFEIGDLDVRSVSMRGAPLKTRTVDRTTPPRTRAQQLDIGVPVGKDPVEIEITYRFQDHDKFDGWVAGSDVSFLWPYFCSNLYPCHSSPADGSTFTMKVTGVPAGETAVFAESIPFEAPTYMPAIAVGRFTFTELGTTRAGTQVGVFKLAGASAGTAAATAEMVDIFDWYEQTIGPYKFGKKVASVQANWGPGAFGGMEHHPFWHVAEGAMGTEEVHAHEAAHGWFGDGVRIRCWEDFVLSEGTTSYLAARAIEQTRGPAAGQEIWASYRSQLARAIAGGDTRAWPQTCNQIDILADGLFSDLPYMKGAFFFRAVAKEIGPDKLDEVLAVFYQERRGTAAGMQDLLDAIQAQTGFDPSALASHWLR